MNCFLCNAVNPQIAATILRKLDMIIKTGVITKLSEAMASNCNLKLPKKKAATTRSTVLSTSMRVRGTRKHARWNPSLVARSLSDFLGEEEEAVTFLLWLPIFSCMCSKLVLSQIIMNECVISTGGTALLGRSAKYHDRHGETRWEELGRSGCGSGADIVHT